MIHSGENWKQQQEGEGLAVCRVRRGCTKEELEMERRMFFNTPWDRGGCETTKAALCGKKMPRKGGANLLFYRILCALTWPSDGHSRLRQLLLTLSERF